MKKSLAFCAYDVCFVDMNFSFMVSYISFSTNPLKSLLILFGLALCRLLLLPNVLGILSLCIMALLSKLVHGVSIMFALLLLLVEDRTAHATRPVLRVVLRYVVMMVLHWSYTDVLQHIILIYEVANVIFFEELFAIFLLELDYFT